MKPSAEALLGTVIRIGETNTTQLIKYAIRISDYKRTMWRAIHLLKIGKVAAARKTLEEALADDNK
jgi:hypothetical protein